MEESKPGKSKPALRIPCSGEASTEIHCPSEQNSSFMVTRPRAERIEPMADRSRFRTAERYSWVGPTRMIPRIKSERVKLQTIHLVCRLLLEKNNIYPVHTRTSESLWIDYSYTSRR